MKNYALLLLALAAGTAAASVLDASLVQRLAPRRPLPASAATQRNSTAAGSASPFAAGSASPEARLYALNR